MAVSESPSIVVVVVVLVLPFGNVAVTIAEEVFDPFVMHASLNRSFSVYFLVCKLHRLGT